VISVKLFALLPFFGLIMFVPPFFTPFCLRPPPTFPKQLISDQRAQGRFLRLPFSFQSPSSCVIGVVQRNTMSRRFIPPYFPFRSTLFEVCPPQMIRAYAVPLYILRWSRLVFPSPWTFFFSHFPFFPFLRQFSLPFFLRIFASLVVCCPNAQQIFPSPCCFFFPTRTPQRTRLLFCRRSSFRLCGFLSH